METKVLNFVKRNPEPGDVTTDSFKLPEVIDLVKRLPVPTILNHNSWSCVHGSKEGAFNVQTWKRKGNIIIVETSAAELETPNETTLTFSKDLWPQVIAEIWVHLETKGYVCSTPKVAKEIFGKKE